MDKAGTNFHTRWYHQEEIIYSILGGGIVATLIFWPLLNSIFSLALFAYWLFFSKKKFPLRQFSTLLLIICSLPYLLLLIGILYSSDMKEAVFKLQQKSPLLIFPLVVATSGAWTESIKKRILWVLCWSTLAGCLVCLINGAFLFIREGTTYKLHGYPMVILKDMHPVVLGLCCLLCLTFLFERWYTSRKNHTSPDSWPEILLACFFIIFLLLVGNRSNLFSLVALVIFYAFRLIRNIKNRLVLIAAMTLALVLTIQLNPSFKRQWNDLTDFSQQNTIDLNKTQDPGYNYGGKTIRLTIWKCSVDIIKESWLTGVGTGDVYDALAEAYRKRNFNAAFGHREYNAHNQYLQETIAYGISGFLAIVLCILVPLIYYTRRKDNTIYIIFLLLFAFVCMTEGILELNKGIVWYAFFNALMAFTPFHKSPQAKTSAI